MKIGFIFVSLFNMSLFVLGNTAFADSDPLTGSVLLHGVPTPVTVSKVDEFDGYSITLGAESGVGIGTPTVPETSSVIIAASVKGSAGKRTFFTYVRDDDSEDLIFDEQVKLLVTDQTLANKAEIKCLPGDNAIVTVMEDGKAPMANCVTFDH